MPSPFPGMDPYIEGQIWEDFHHGFIELIREALAPEIRPGYVVRVEERIYVEHHPDDRSDPIRPDLAVLQNDTTAPRPGASAATLAAPVLLNLPIPQRRREAFLTLRACRNMEVVAVIELLSPGNKRNGGDGQREYLNKRESVLCSAAHLIELDLLRGGERLPTVEPLPQADYYAFICRAEARPSVLVYPWALRQPSPVIPIPLSGQDSDVPLDLQSAFTTLYDRAGYDASLDYTRPVSPPLDADDATWVQRLIRRA
jgi:hypothetical protein